MKKRTTIIIAGIGVLAAVGIWFFLPAPENSTETPTINTDGIQPIEGVAPTDAILYFTEKGCASMPLVSVTDESNTERALDENFPATDGYDYAIIEGTRESRTILARFTGICEDISPAQLDTYQAFEVGVTSTGEPEEGI